MPEGDTIWKSAEALRKALQGKTLTGFETSVPEIAHYGSLAGRVVQDVLARGKHLLVVLRDPGRGPIADLALHTHLRMTGSWHIYRRGHPWKKPARLARVVLRTPDIEAPCFLAPVVELLTTADVARHPALKGLGPDATAEAFDADEAVARLRTHPDLPIGVALLKQGALAGIGNVFKSEVLFLEKVNPFVHVADLPEAALRALVARARTLLVENRSRTTRRTRSSLDPAGRVWVYRRSGRACYTCGTAIRMRKQGPEARTTYFCPRCQRAGS